MSPYITSFVRRRARHVADDLDAPPAPLLMEGVVASYGAVQALRGFTLTLAPGEAMALLGANGAGKSTALRAISGVIRCREGSIIFGDKQLTRYRPHEIVRLGIIHVPEGRRIFVGQTVLENLKLGAAVRQDSKAALSLRDVVDLFPLLRDKLTRPAGLLSGGEQQALAIARGVLGNPRVLLLDEPSLGLAPRLVDDLQALITNLRSLRAFSMLIVEQDAYLAAQTTDRVGVMRRGRIIREFPSSELLQNRDLLRDYLSGDTTISGGH